MPVYTIAICDDNVSFAQAMAEQCKEVMQKLNIPYTIRLFYSFEDVLRDYSKGNKVDLMFLDIMLGRKNGIDLARRLKEYGYNTSVVLITVERSYLLAGYEVQPIYFLLKPIHMDELEKAIKLDLKRMAESKYIILKCDRKYVQIPVETILYIEVMDHDLTVHTRARDYSVRMTFSQILEELPPSQFARCHNSFAVNLAHVLHFSRAEGVVLDCRQTLPLGRKYFEEFRRSFIEYIDIC